MAGLVESIHLAERRSAPAHPVERVRAVAGTGLEGDRHFGRPHSMSLIEAEAIDDLAKNTGIELGQGEPRRQVVVRGVDLNALVGRRFRVGAVECVGEELAHPCRHMERLTQNGVLKGLAGRGGIYAEIVNDGEIAVGDPVEPLDDR